jgi:4-amino-4-deoxy-L-arabinose transferase-like glycosyltransferase
VAVVLATLAATVLRLTDLGGKSFWLDEAFSVALARAPWPSFVHELRTSEANMGLYYTILRPWLCLGLSEASVRLLSALVGIATIPVVYAIGARLFGRRAGIVAAFVLALDPVHLALSQDARGYALAIFLVTCSTWAFVHVVSGEPRRGRSDSIAAEGPTDPEGRGRARPLWSVLYVLTSAGAVYSHLYAVFVLLAQFASLLRRQPHSTPWRRLALCGLAITLLLVPMGAFLLRGSHNNINWIATEIPYVIVHVFFSVIVAYVTIIVALALRGRRMLSSRDAGQDGWPYILALLWLGTPIMLPLIVSVMAKPIFDPRYASVSLPAIALLAGAFVSQAPGGWGGYRAIAIVLFIAALELFGDWTYFSRLEKEDWRSATQSVLAAAAPGDVVAFYAPYVRRPYEYYVERDRGSTRAPLVLYPSKGYATLTPGDRNELTLAEAIARAERTAPRTWLVLGHARPDSACRRALDASLRTAYRTVEERRFVGVEVWLYANRSADNRDAGRFDEAAPTAAAIAHQCTQT